MVWVAFEDTFKREVITCFGKDHLFKNSHFTTKLQWCWKDRVLMQILTAFKSNCQRQSIQENMSQYQTRFKRARILCKTETKNGLKTPCPWNPPCSLAEASLLLWHPENGLKTLCIHPDISIGLDNLDLGLRELKYVAMTFYADGLVPHEY